MGSCHIAYSARSSAWHSDNLERWDGVGGEREVQEEGDMCISMVNSSCCMVGTNTILKQLSSN